MTNQREENTMSNPFSVVRCNPIIELADLAGQERHGRGNGPRARASRKREGPRALAWSVLAPTTELCEVGSDKKQLSLIDSLEHFVEKNGANFYNSKTAAKCLHLIVAVSPEWVAEKTDSRNPDENFRLVELMRAAKGWVEEAMGDGNECVFATRLDLDETGAGNVDVLVAPLRENRRSKKLFVSTGKARLELAERVGMPNAKSYSAMQDSWNAYANKHLDGVFQRGVPAAESARKHVHTRTLREMAKDAAPEIVRRNKELEQIVLDQKQYAQSLERRIENMRRGGQQRAVG